MKLSLYSVIYVGVEALNDLDDIDPTKRLEDNSTKELDVCNEHCICKRVADQFQLYRGSESESSDSDGETGAAKPHPRTLRRCTLLVDFSCGMEVVRYSFN